jgi:branched-chain amino acid transport system permease protein
MNTLPIAQPSQPPVLAAWRRHASEIVFWALPVIAYFVFPDDLALLSQIAITALLVLSLDLILGYAGIVSLGHAAFFGLGAYAAGLPSRPPRWPPRWASSPASWCCAAPTSRG